MNKKISLGLAISCIFLAVAIAVSITMMVSLRIYNSMVKDVSPRSGVHSTVSEIDDIIRENYFGEINENLLKTMLTDGYVEGIGDRYSTYMTASEYASYKEEEKGNKEGIGVIAVYDSKNNNIYVSEVAEGSPAQLQGIQRGDVITSVDSTEVNASNYEELLKKLEGEKLTNVQLTFTHDGKSNTVSVARGYQAQYVFYSVNNNVGYIKITAFYKATAEQLENALSYMKDKDVSSVIFDVRNNSTGLISDATVCIDLLVPVAVEGTNAIATAVDKEGKTIETFTSDSKSSGLGMVVLVNSKTSGAAELFACDLRDFGMAQLVGDRTEGNGTMQKIFELSDGSAISLTVARIIPYKSESYNGTGIEPDHYVEISNEEFVRLEMLSFEEDAQYKKAMSLLGN